MAVVKRVVSSLLLACGIVLVFAGLNGALGFTIPAIGASVTAIAALLYAGAVWFGVSQVPLAPPGTETVIVFDRALQVAAGGAPGAPLLPRFPEALRPEIEMRCRAALRGEHTHFVCDYKGRQVAFDFAPVQMVDGVVLYGVLIIGSSVRVSNPSAAPLATVA